SLEALVPQAQPGNLEGNVAEGRLQRHLGGGVAVGVGIAGAAREKGLGRRAHLEADVSTSTLAFLIAVQRLPAGTATCRSLSCGDLRLVRILGLHALA